ncbi:MAG: hypothetical protein IKL65_00110 [Bacilli bacterium]|nr:hypothetical protein [Bacilli bacterium]
MNLLDEVFNDLIKDLNYWNKCNQKGDSVLSRLENLKDTLEEHIDTIETDIRLQEQDSSFVGIDERIEEMRIV